VQIQRKPDGYKELLVYKRAEELRLYIVKLTEKLPYSEQRRKVHLNDSARSVKQNIVEGWKRSTTKEYYEFLSFSLGSLAEIKEDVKDLFEDKKILQKTFDFFDSKCRELDYLLNRLRQSLYRKMDNEGTLPAKEVKRNILNQKQSEQDILDKIIANAGLIRLPNVKYVKGETGKKG
jgi:four helix bundle protein